MFKLMKTILIFILSLISTSTWALSLDCPQRDVTNKTFPSQHVEWVVDEGSDGVNGYIFRVNENINNLVFLSANFVIAGKTKSDYLIPLKFDVYSGVVKSGFYAPKSELEKVFINLVYGEKSDLCGSKNIVYSLFYGTPKT